MAEEQKKMTRSELILEINTLIKENLKLQQIEHKMERLKRLGTEYKSKKVI